MKPKTKPTAILFVLLIISGLSFGQDYKKNLAKEYNEYLTAITTMNFEKAMEYMVPEFNARNSRLACWQIAWAFCW